MVNEELIELCRTVIGAIGESDTFDAQSLRRLILHIVPQLLAEIDILERILETVRLPEAVDAVFEVPPPPKKEKKAKRKRGKR